MGRAAPSAGHPLANGVCAGLAVAGGVYFEGARIDALAAAAGEVLRTSEPMHTCYGMAQVRRSLWTSALRMVHVVFAPERPRPLLLGLVRLLNASRDLLQVEYTELWDLTGTDLRAAEGACVCVTPYGVRALAEAASVIRARPPDPLPSSHLALDLRVPLPPGAQRHLSFAYVSPPTAEEAALLVQAWRGDVARELVRTVERWLARLGDHADAVAAYRQMVSRELAQAGP